MDGEAADRYFETLYASSQVKEDVAATILTIQQLAGMGRCRRQFPPLPQEIIQKARCRMMAAL